MSSPVERFRDRRTASYDTFEDWLSVQPEQLQGKVRIRRRHLIRPEESTLALVRRHIEQHGKVRGERLA